MRNNWQRKGCWAAVVIWSMLLLGCREPRPPQVVEVVTAGPTATETAVTPVPNPTIAAVLAQITPTSSPTPSPSPAFTATLFVCPTPPGWQRYVVQANDTLESLARKTGTAVDILKAANCLIDDIIIIGDQIFLPTLPPPPPPPVFIPQQVENLPTTQAQACSPFGCPDSTLLAFTLPGGLPNEGTPCLTDEMKIEAQPPARTVGVRQRGENVSFFACGFPEYSTVTAKLFGPNSVEILTPQPSQNIPDYKGKSNIPYVNWGVKCDASNGPYVVMFTDAQGNTLTTTFTVEDTSFKRILAIPPFGPPGTKFDLYYCGYPPTAPGQNGEVIEFYYALDRRMENQEVIYDWALSTPWPIVVNEDGWASNTLSSQLHDPVNSYLLMNEDKTGLHRQIWLVNP